MQTKEIETTPRRLDTRAAYALYSTPWGRGLVAGQDDLVVRIYLPNGSEESLLSSARAELGPLEIDRDRGTASTLADAMERYFRGEPVSLEYPLDLSYLTPFQRRVMQAAISIPRGTVRTYGWLASEAGSPGASRACGQVMATNRYPVVAPCHRVVAANGRLGGYSGGLHWKVRLLKLESVDVDEANLTAGGL